MIPWPAYPQISYSLDFFSAYLNVIHIAWHYFARHFRLADMKLRDRLALNIQERKRARGLS